MNGARGGGSASGGDAGSAWMNGSMMSALLLLAGYTVGEVRGTGKR